MDYVHLSSWMVLEYRNFWWRRTGDWKYEIALSLQFLPQEAFDS